MIINVSPPVRQTSTLLSSIWIRAVLFFLSALLLFPSGLYPIGGPEARVAYFSLLNQGFERLTAGDGVGARDAFMAACQLNLSNVRPRIGLARAYLALGQADAAVLALEPYEHYGRSQPDFQLIWAQSELARKEPARAIARVEPLLKTLPTHAPAHQVKGQALLMLGDDAGGLAELQEAVRLAPGDRQATESLARYYLDRKQPDKALAILRKMQNAMGGDAQTADALAAAEGALGDPHAAAAELLQRGRGGLAAMAQMLQSLPAPIECPAAPLIPAELLACGRFGAARAALEAAAARSGHDELLLARACLWQGDNSCAARAYLAAAAQLPEQAIGLERLAARLGKPLPPIPSTAPASRAPFANR